MATIAEIRAGFARNLQSIPDVQVEPTGAYQLSDPTPPTIHVFPDEVEYDQAMQRGTDSLRWVVQAFVGLQTDIGAQMKLDEFLAPTGAYSIKEAVESDPTLGGVVDDLQVVSATGHRVYAVEGRGSFLGCDWNVEVID